MLKIKWFGHSMWKISNDIVDIVIDPFDNIGYPLPNDLTTEILICSHQHHDHNNISLLQHYDLLINNPGNYTFKDITIVTYESDHDGNNGLKRGKNLLSLITINNKNILHCGDLGAIPSKNTLASLKDIYAIMIPIGGVFTLDFHLALDLIDILKPQIIFPMHYKTRVLNFELNTIDSFKNASKNFYSINNSFIDLESSDFTYPATIQLNYDEVIS